MTDEPIRNMLLYEGMMVYVVRGAHHGDKGYNPGKGAQVLIHLPDGHERVVTSETLSDEVEKAKVAAADKVAADKEIEARAAAEAAKSAKANADAEAKIRADKPAPSPPVDRSRPASTEPLIGQPGQPGPSEPGRRGLPSESEAFKSRPSTRGPKS